MAKREFDFITLEYPGMERKTVRAKRTSVNHKAKKKSAKVEETADLTVKPKRRKTVKAVKPKNFKVVSSKPRKTKKTKPRKTKTVHTVRPIGQTPIEREFDEYIDEPYSTHDNCNHSHHMHCIRCGLQQFAIGMVTGLAMALIIAKIAFA